jgi:hypothetical protein
MIAVIEQLQLLEFFRKDFVRNWHLLVAISRTHLKEMSRIDRETNRACSLGVIGAG